MRADPLMIFSGRRSSTLLLACVGVAVLFLCGQRGFGSTIAHWSFDNLAGGTFSEDTGNHNATVVTNGTGAVALSAGIFGSAVSFNNAAGGQATNNAYLSFPNLTELMGPTGTSFSISAWVQTTNTTSNNTVLGDWGNVTTTNRFVYWFSLQNASSNTQAQPRAQTRSSNSPNTDIIARNAPINVGDGNWNHVVWTFDKPSKVLNTYVNGTLADTFTTAATSVDILQSDSPIGTIGRKADTNNYFVGSIDELWVVDHALTPAEVESLRSLNVVPEPGTLISLSAGVGLLCILRRRRWRGV